MRQVVMSKPAIGFLAVTRGLLGAGGALLLSPRWSERTRRIAGWTLFAVGVATTIPLIAYVFRRDVSDELASD
jgi:hypothetical protein